MRPWLATNTLKYGFEAIEQDPGEHAIYGIVQSYALFSVWKPFLAYYWDSERTTFFRKEPSWLCNHFLEWKIADPLENIGGKFTEEIVVLRTAREPSTNIAEFWREHIWTTRKHTQKTLDSIEG